MAISTPRVMPSSLVSPKVLREDSHLGHASETGIAAVIDDGGPYESMRNKLLALSRV
jgi:hypothetical protein